MDSVSAFADDALGRHDAVGLVEQLASGAVSATELVRAAIQRTEKVNPTLNGLSYDAFDRALARAAATRRDHHHPYFHGVPTFLKDNVQAAGMPMSQGSDAWNARPAATNGAFAEDFLATGVLPLGRTRMSEFGLSASAEHPRLGAVRNPWNPEYTAGASSSGSAAFVAAGVVPLAHANDGGGSIRIPASCTGLVGLKPSRGRLPLDKEVRNMPVLIVANGAVSRSVRDTAAFYREMERVHHARRLPRIGDVTSPGRARLRVAVCTQSIARQASPEITDLVLDTAALLEELGHRVATIDNPVPASFKDDFVLYWAFLAFALIRGGRLAFGASFDRTRLDNLSTGLERWAARHLYRLPLAIARLSRTRRVTERLSQRFDVVLTPTLAETTPRVGHLDPMADYDQIISRLVDWVGFTPLHNVTGEPAISLPLAQSVDGLPVGMMFSAPIGHEARLLELAFELEAARPFAVLP